MVKVLMAAFSTMVFKEEIMQSLKFFFFFFKFYILACILQKEGKNTAILKRAQRWTENMSQGWKTNLTT